MERYDANNRLAFALCEEYGIDTKGMSPKDAWDALKDKTGKSASEIFKTEAGSGTGSGNGGGHGKSSVNTTPISDKDLVDGVNAIRSRVKSNGGHYTNADFVECGELIERARGKTIDSRDHTKELHEAGKRVTSLKAICMHYGNLSGDQADKNAKAIGFADANAAKAKFKSDLSTLGIKTDGLTDEQVLNLASQELATARNKRNQIRDKDPHKENAESLSRTIGKVRDVGGAGSNYNRKNSQSANDFEDDNVFKYLPKDWVDASNASGHFGIIDEQNRAFCSPSGNIHVNTQNPNPSTNMHETMHRMESCVKGLRRVEKNFFDYRKGSESPQLLSKLTGNPAYGREMAIKDNYVNPYMGKDYSGMAFELMSMGGEWAYFNPDKFSKDPEMRRWMYGVLAML